MTGASAGPDSIGEAAREGLQTVLYKPFRARPPDGSRRAALRPAAGADPSPGDGTSTPFSPPPSSRRPRPVAEELHPARAPGSRRVVGSSWRRAPASGSSPNFVVITNISHALGLAEGLGEPDQARHRGLLPPRSRVRVAYLGIKGLGDLALAPCEAPQLCSCDRRGRDPTTSLRSGAPPPGDGLGASLGDRLHGRHEERGPDPRRRVHLGQEPPRQQESLRLRVCNWDVAMPAAQSMGRPERCST